MKTKWNWMEILLLALPFLVLPLVWNNLPARVPIHWNLGGEVDRWSSKLPGLLFLPLFGIGLTLLLRALPWLDPKLRRAGAAPGRMETVLPVLRIAILGLLDRIFFLQIAASLGKEIDTGRIVFSAVLILLLVLGNFLGNLRPNYFVGIRTPWTLENPETWRATHRLGGRLLFFGALVLLGAQFFLGRELFGWVFLVAILALVIWGLLYSWHHFRTHAGSR